MKRPRDCIDMFFLNAEEINALNNARAHSQKKKKKSAELWMTNMLYLLRSITQTNPIHSAHPSLPYCFGL